MWERVNKNNNKNNKNMPQPLHESENWPVCIVQQVLILQVPEGSAGIMATDYWMLYVISQL